MVGRFLWRYDREPDLLFRAASSRRMEDEVRAVLLPEPPYCVQSVEVQVGSARKHIASKTAVLPKICCWNPARRTTSAGIFSPAPAGMKKFAELPRTQKQMYRGQVEWRRSRTHR